MTAKQELRVLVEGFDNVEAELALAAIRGQIQRHVVSTNPEESATTSFDDPLWRLVGLGHSDEPTDVASDKDEYLAEAFGDLHER
ncbi:MAG: hypothetical protein ACR2OO_08945 [Thermomicrobiales bacterium]